jgi:hypothetical protein
MAGLPYHVSKLLARIGTQSIYKESGLIVPVRLVEMMVQKDDFHLAIEPFEAPGLSRRMSRGIEVGGAVEYIGIHKKYISNPYINSLLFTDLADVAHLIRFAATLPDMDDLLSEFRLAMHPEFSAKRGMLATRRPGIDERDLPTLQASAVDGNKPPRNSRTVTGLTYHLLKLFPLIGREYVYKEGKLIKLVRLFEVKIQEDSVKFILEPIDAPGFGKRVKKKFEVGCAPDCLTIQKRYMSASYGRWYLFTDPGEVKGLVKFADGLPDTQELVKKLHQEMDPRPSAKRVSR